MCLAIGLRRRTQCPDPGSALTGQLERIRCVDLPIGKTHEVSVILASSNYICGRSIPYPQMSRVSLAADCLLLGDISAATIIPLSLVMDAQDSPKSNRKQW